MRELPLDDGAERLQAVRVLREAEARFHCLAAAAPIGLFQTDAERQCLYTNDRWQTICGLTHEECLGYGWSRVLHPDDRAAVLREWARAAREGREAVVEHRIVTPPGAIRWVCLRIAPLSAGDGALSGCVGTLEDVTDRRQAEEGLRSREERFRALTERSWDGISLVSAEGTILYNNHSDSAWAMGFTASELTGRNAFERLHPDDLPQVMATFRSIVREPGAAATAEFRSQHKDGSWRWIECVGTNLLAEPSVQAIVANYRDITERKQAEQEIQQRNRELAALNVITAAVSSSLDLTKVLATFRRLVAEELGVPGGMIFFPSSAGDQLCLQEHWGLPESVLPQLTGLPMAGSHWELVIRARQALLVPDFREVALFFALRLDVARPEWQSYLAIPLIANDQLEGIMGLFSAAPVPFHEDQPAFFEAFGQQVAVALQNARLFQQASAWRERLESLSRRLVELQEAERRHLARELHDEIGQLLTGLRLTLEMSLRVPVDERSEMVVQAVESVSELIARVRQLSLDLRPSMLDDLGLLPALQWHIDRYISQTQIRVAFEHSGIDRRLPPDVETAVYRIVQEALTNVARHAGVASASVRIRADEDTLEVRIEDQGAGFDAAAIAAASGCGLAGMRDRAILLGGRLTVDTTPGAGTRLTAEVPLGPPIQPSKEDDDEHRCGR